MQIFKDILLPVLGKLDPTGIVDLVRPKARDIADKTGTTTVVVDRVLDAIKEDPEIARLQADIEKARMETEKEIARISAGNLAGISDQTGEFSWVRALAGSPRRLGVTVAVLVIGALSLVVGGKAIFVDNAIADPDGLAVVFDSMKWIVVGLGGAYGMKYFGREGK